MIMEAALPELYPEKDDETKAEYKTAVKIWERKINKFADREDQYDKNKEALFSIIWAQCSDSMQAKVRMCKDYKRIRRSQDCLALLKEIQGITYKFESQRYPYEAYFDAMLSFFQNRQHKNQSNSDYLTKFKNMVTVIEHYGGSFGKDPMLIKEVVNKDQDTNVPVPKEGSKEYKEATKIARDRFLGYAFLRCSDPNRYNKFMTHMSNQYNVGQNQFPEDITAAYGMILHYKSDTKSKEKDKPSSKTDDDGDGDEADTSFMLNSNNSKTYSESNISASAENKDDIVKDDDISASDSISLRLEETEHAQAVNFLLDHANDDSDASDSGLDDFDHPDFGFLQAGTSVHDTSPYITTYQNLDHIFVHSKFLNPNWILLDNQSTVHIFQNKDLVNNVSSVLKNKQLICHTNGGSQVSQKQATFRDFGRVWFNNQSLANILSFATVRKTPNFTVDYNQAKNAFIVTLPDKSVMSFIQSPRGLYYYGVRWKLER